MTEAIQPRTLSLADVVYREDLYPRIKPDAVSDDDLLIIVLRFLDHFHMNASILDGIMPLRGSSLQKSAYRNAVLRFFGAQCFICGYTHFVDVHHVRHRVHSGSDRIDNLVTLCPNHHKEWHYIERAFFTGLSTRQDANIRGGRAIAMDYEIPHVVLHNNIAPFLIRIAQIGACA